MVAQVTCFINMLSVKLAMEGFRGILFIGLFLLFTAIETRFSSREMIHSWNRKIHNLLFPMGTNLIFRFLIPLLMVFGSEIHFDLFGYFHVEGFFRVILAVIIMDLMVYIQHVISHKIPLLWRFHRMHHSDTEMDASTGVRFHPIELILSVFYKYLCYSLIGVDVLGIFFFEVILNASAMFNHMNISLPSKVDNWLSYIIVTPNMHLNHHQSDSKFTNSNYGFFLSIWDRLFKTHTKHINQSVEIGLKEFRSDQDQKVSQLLLQPFK